VRLASLRVSGDEVLAVVAGNDWLAASEALPGSARTMAQLIAAGPAALEALRQAATPAAIADRGRPLAGVEMLAPLPVPGKIVAIGRNYREHATEEGVDPPTAPLVFAKFPGSVVGPGAEIVWDPDLTSQVDYEAELAVVIGRRARRIEAADALDHVFGYTCLNDVSARDLQFGDGQWVRGKSLDTFCPMGPVLVTADAIGDPQDLAISCMVGDERLQEARTSAMYFGIAEIISFCSRSFTLEPGDVIATGTPGGVGVFRDPPRFLGDGDRVVVEIEGIGRLENVCRHEHVGHVRPAGARATEATA
jgi:2-keto-4-pentenoate hydratase/2-oxohepta-3-ene-1,7-dioic acid hydratase in catechol pathway